MNYKELLVKVRRFYKTQRRLPTYSELAKLCGYASKNAAYKIANKLISLGYITKDTTGKLIPHKLFAPLPLSGIVPAGTPINTTQNYSDIQSIDEFLIEKPEKTYLLTVTGDSMIEAGILPGDIVVVEQGRSPKNHDIVVAQVDGEWTLKYYETLNNKPILLPANKKYKTIIPTALLSIDGIVTSVIRKIQKN